MSSVLAKLVKEKLTNPPDWLADNVHYEVIGGSVSYGASNDRSDQDITGFCIPPKEVVFPHLAGKLYEWDYGNEGKPKFPSVPFQHHHINCKSDGNKYDIAMYGIVHFFKLCADCNPNMIGTLYVPVDCIRHITEVGQLVRDNRKKFLSKRLWVKFRGYAYSQLTKLEKAREDSKREELIQQFGYDVKFAAHVVRLLGEAEQLIVNGEMDMRRDSEVLKSIRKGLWKKEDIINHFQSRATVLDELFLKSNLPEDCDRPYLKNLLFQCLEHHYGSIDGIVRQKDNGNETLKKIIETLKQDGYC